MTDRHAYVVRGTHRTLVSSLPHGRSKAAPPTSAARGLVVVPLSRGEPLLETPARIAIDLDWPLLLICSHGNRARQVRALIAALWPDVPVIAVDLPSRPQNEDTRWSTGWHWAAHQRHAIDTDRKRNLALAAARVSGFAWVMFVDDDILRLPSSHVVEGLGHLASTGQSMVGWAAEYFPDNSVVHHARRDFLKLNQEVFLGAGALMLRVDTGELPMFPPVYNEDWLFLFRPIAAGAVSLGPDVGHLQYDPYADSQRARLEEFGDVLGEGLFHLLHEKLGVEVALEADYWRSVHGKRTKLVQRIIGSMRERLSVVASEGEHDRLTRALAAILESRHQLTRATPESLADFVLLWQRDEELWREYLARLPERDSLREALVYLGLHESWIVTS